MPSPLSTSLSSPVRLFSESCQLCHKNKIQYKDKKIKPSLISTVHAERNFKENAGVKNTSLYNEIKDLDLIAPKLKYDHVSCYRDFNRNIDNIKESV